MTSAWGRIVVYAVLYVAWLAALFAQTGGFADTQAWLKSWTQWDAFWYLGIWDNGYPTDNLKSLAFPPGYPYLIGSLSSLLGTNFHMTAMGVNLFAYFFALVLAAELLSAVASVRASGVLFALFLTAPTGYFALATYSDPMFMLILWSALYLAVIYPDSRRARIGVRLLLLASPWVRLTGYALTSWLLLKRWSAGWVFVSLAAWLLLNTLIAGNPFYFVEAQKLFSMDEGWFLGGMVYTFSGLLPLPQPGHWTSYLQFHLLPAFYLVALTLVALWFLRNGTPLVGVTIIAILLLSHNQQFWRSTVRYDLPLMPCLFAPLLAYVERKGLRPRGALATLLIAAVALAQMGLQIAFARMFKSGQWGF